jgi:peptide/nickel transport system permease protein
MNAAPAVTAAAPPATASFRSRVRWRELPYFPALILIVVVVAGLGAQWLAPHDPLRGELGLRNTPPFWIQGGSIEYPLGTDHLGRDMLSRMLYGARISLALSSVALLVGGAAGTIMGLISGWYGGWVDEASMRLVDIFLSLPLVLLTLVLVVTFGASFPLIVVVLASWVWVRIARQVRGEVLRLKQLDHVALARVAGASTARILRLHILPGVRNTLIVVATLQVGILILLEATLSFLGAGVPPPTPSWGAMVADGRSQIVDAWWISTLPGVAILLTLLALNLLGDWLRDVFDPRLQQMG